MQTTNAAAIDLFRRRLSGVHRVRWNPSDIHRIAERFGLVEREIQAALSSPAAKEILPTTRTAGDAVAGYTFTISTPAIDRMGDSVSLNWRLSEYLRNSVVLFGHASDALPIGRSAAVWITGEKLKATVKLAPATANPLAEQVRHLLDGRFLSACSVGFIPLRWEFSKDPARPYGINFLEQTLLEWSIVDIPANQDCLMDSGQQTGKSAAARRRARELDLIRIGSR